MNEKATKIALAEPKTNLICGHTRIELTSITTGEKKIIEHKNTFQSTFLSKYLRSLGAYNNNPFSNSIWAGRRIWRNLTGGILLFRDEITPGTEYMPAGNVMVANGSYGVTNNGTPSELGSYNSIESSTNGNNSLSFVYDWGTSQGNGTIGCVCLTTEVGGLIGYGNTSGAAFSTITNLLENQSGTDDNAGIPYKNKLYSFTRDGSNKTVTITKTKKAISEASLFDKQSVETETKTYSSAIAGSGISANYIGGGKFALLPIQDQSWDNKVDPAGTFIILIYDAESKTLTEKTVTNDSSNTLALSGYNEAQRTAVIAENFLICPSFVSAASVGKPINIIDIDGVESAEEIPDAADIETLRGAYFGVAPGLIALHQDTTSKMYLFDTVNKTTLITNGKLEGNSIATNQVRAYHDEIDAFYTKLDTGGGLYKNPLLLATINNLDNPVTKDSTQTMKVIYTLTEAS